MHLSKEKTAQLKDLENEDGIQSALNKAFALLGNPLLIYDMDFRLIACPEHAVCDDPIWMEFMQREKLSDRTIGFFNDEGFIDTVSYCIQQGDDITYLLSDKMPYDWIFGRLYNKDRMPVAGVVMVASDAPFSKSMPTLFRQVCDILSKKLSEDTYFQEYGQIYQEMLIKKLIENDIEDREIYTDHIAHIDQGLKTVIYLAVADISRCTAPGPECAAHYRDLLRQVQPAYKYFVYAGQVVILLSFDEPLPRGKRNFPKLQRVFEQEDISVGVSDGFENLFELSVYYAEAQKMLGSDVQAAGKQRVRWYGDTVSHANRRKG